MKSQKTAIGILVLFLGLCFGATLAHAQVSHPGHTNFDTRDRKVAVDWYKAHPDAFKSNEAEWHADWEPNMREGFVLTPDMRKAVHRVPTELETQFGPAPEGYRYVELGDHVLIIDNDYRIHSELHFETF